MYPSAVTGDGSLQTATDWQVMTNAGQIACVDREQRDHPSGIDGGRGRARRRRRGGHARRARPCGGRRGPGPGGRRRAGEGALTMSATGLAAGAGDGGADDGRQPAAALRHRSPPAASRSAVWRRPCAGSWRSSWNREFLVGFVLYFVASVVWFRVVATERLSVAYPLLVSCTFTLVTAGAVIVFGESLTPPTGARAGGHPGGHRLDLDARREARHDPDRHHRLRLLGTEPGAELRGDAGRRGRRGGRPRQGQAGQRAAPLSGRQGDDELPGAAERPDRRRHRDRDARSRRTSSSAWRRSRSASTSGSRSP